MNVAGQPVLSRSTIASGRGLFLLSTAIILAGWYDVDYSTVEFLGITLDRQQVNGGMIWVLLVMLVSHLVHWLGDYFSLGEFNSSLFEKTSGKVFDEGGDKVSHLESVLRQLRKLQESDNDVPNLELIAKELAEIKSNMWWYVRYSFFYVVGWHLIVPIVLTGFALHHVICASP